jgi:hypothetical protein
MLKPRIGHSSEPVQSTSHPRHFSIRSILILSLIKYFNPLLAEASTSPISKAATGHDPEPVPSTFSSQSQFLKIRLDFKLQSVGLINCVSRNLTFNIVNNKANHCTQLLTSSIHLPSAKSVSLRSILILNPIKQVMLANGSALPISKSAIRHGPETF